MKPILEIEQLSKVYRIRKNREPYFSLRESIGNIFKSKNEKTEEFYALKEISFKVEAGESIGIIGKNGAGKSTLLKILSKITPPTSGRIVSRGRIASLLEVGTGFHPELTGRENIFLNGSILGMKRFEIQKKFDEIIDFSGVERFLDTPLKHYSSGMQLRLAFAVAAFLEPEILVIDEVLAVGDAEFQKKCLGKMEDVTKNEGRTLLFVSHDMNAIVNLTSRCIQLHNGQLILDAPSKKVIENYLNTGSLESQFSREINPEIKIPQIVKVEIKTSLPDNKQVIEEAIEFLVSIYFPTQIINSVTFFTLQISDLKGRNYVHLTIDNRTNSLSKKQGLHTINMKLPKCRLYMGTYVLNLFLSGPPGSDIYDKIFGICPFEVIILGKSRDWDFYPEECAYIEDVVWNINGEKLYEI